MNLSLSRRRGLGKAAPRLRHRKVLPFGPCAAPSLTVAPLHPVLQAKLKIGEPNDPYEQEADRLADMVMRSEGVSRRAPSAAPAALQRTCAACTSGRGLCANCAEEEILRPAGANNNPLKQVGKMVQRAVLENDPSTAPPMSCTVPLNTVTDYVLMIPFTESNATLSAVDKMILADFATEWNLSPVQPMVRVDGFASIDGGPATNWPLSCDRAVAVANELKTPSAGGKPGIPASSVEFFANGETDRFSTNFEPNRTAAIHAPGMAPPTSREPSVFRWLSNNSGSTDPTNCCAICPVNLGVDCDPPNFRNGIEFAISIRDHDPSYSYDIKRTLEAKYHRTRDLPLGTSGPWETVSSWNKPAGTPDDGHDSDECLIPQASGSVHKVFSEDRPGFQPASLRNTYNSYISMVNFVEFVRIQRFDGSTYDDSLQQNWHTKLLVEKSGGTWSVNTSESEIGTGHLSSLDP
ncbi:MAG TPA: OmpA family protein [Chthoniobacterales bacterium]